VLEIPRTRDSVDIDLLTWKYQAVDQEVRLRKLYRHWKEVMAGENGRFFVLALRSNFKGG
jgi:hypothetical protein